MKFASLGCMTTAALLLSVTWGAHAQIVRNPASVTPISLSSAGYTQNFDGLSADGRLTLPGWQIIEQDRDANSTYVLSDGSDDSVGSYSFGSIGSTDRALGSIGRNPFDGGTPTGPPSVRFGAIFTNAQADPITSLALSYQGEKWRASSYRVDGLAFEYKIGTTDLLSPDGWIWVPGLQFGYFNNDVLGVLDGNAPEHNRSLSGTISNLSIGAGQSFALRWTDQIVPGGNDGHGVDDFTLNAITAAVPEPASWAMMMVGFAVIGAATRYRRRHDRPTGIVQTTYFRSA